MVSPLLWTVTGGAITGVADGKEKLLAGKVKATAVVFVRTGQDRSADALRAMAKCEQDLAGKPVRFVAVVSGSWSADEVREAVQEKLERARAAKLIGKSLEAAVTITAAAAPRRVRAASAPPIMPCGAGCLPNRGATRCSAAARPMLSIVGEGGGIRP